jgi:hypothetical protein
MPLTPVQTAGLGSVAASDNALAHFGDEPREPLFAVRQGKRVRSFH